MSQTSTQVKRVLVADDSAISRMNLAGILRDAGFEVQQVARASDIITKIDTSPVPLDVLILDLYFSDHNGIEILSQLQQRSSSIPVLVVSTETDRQVVFKALQMGAKDYIIKPFSPAQILEKIEKCLSRK